MEIQPSSLPYLAIKGLFLYFSEKNNLEKVNKNSFNAKLFLKSNQDVYVSRNSSSSIIANKIENIFFSDAEEKEIMDNEFLTSTVINSSSFPRLNITTAVKNNEESGIDNRFFVQKDSYTPTEFELEFSRVFLPLLTLTEFGKTSLGENAISLLNNDLKKCLWGINSYLKYDFGEMCNVNDFQNFLSNLTYSNSGSKCLLPVFADVMVQFKKNSNSFRGNASQDIISLLNDKRFFVSSDSNIYFQKPYLFQNTSAVDNFENGFFGGGPNKQDLSMDFLDELYSKYNENITLCLTFTSRILKFTKYFNDFTLDFTSTTPSFNMFDTTGRESVVTGILELFRLYAGGSGNSATIFFGTYFSLGRDKSKVAMAKLLELLFFYKHTSSYRGEDGKTLEVPTPIYMFLLYIYYTFNIDCIKNCYIPNSYGRSNSDKVYLNVLAMSGFSLDAEKYFKQYFPAWESDIKDEVKRKADYMNYIMAECISLKDTFIAENVGGDYIDPNVIFPSWKGSLNTNCYHI